MNEERCKLKVYKYIFETFVDLLNGTNTKMSLCHQII